MNSITCIVGYRVCTRPYTKQIRDNLKSLEDNGLRVDSLVIKDNQLLAVCTFKQNELKELNANSKQYLRDRGWPPREEEHKYWDVLIRKDDNTNTYWLGKMCRRSTI